VVHLHAVDIVLEHRFSLFPERFAEIHRLEPKLRNLLAIRRTGRSLARFDEKAPVVERPLSWLKPNA
jgi:hypothetical protein